MKQEKHLTYELFLKILFQLLKILLTPAFLHTEMCKNK